MASSKVLIKTSAAKELAAVVAKSDRQRLVGRIRGPIDDDASVVTILKVGHSKDVHR